MLSRIAYETLVGLRRECVGQFFCAICNATLPAQKAPDGCWVAASCARPECVRERERFEVTREPLAPQGLNGAERGQGGNGLWT